MYVLTLVCIGHQPIFIDFGECSFLKKSNVFMNLELETGFIGFYSIDRNLLEKSGLILTG